MSVGMDQGTERPSLMAIGDFAPFADGLDHPEGVACGPNGELYAGGEAGQIYRVDVESGRWEEIASTGGFVLGLCLDGDGAIYACDHGVHAVKRVGPECAVTTYSSGTPEWPMQTPNYPVFDADGNLYVSDSGTWHGNDGRLYRVRPGGATELVSTAVSAFPNGLALDPDGTALYVVLSNLPGVARLSLAGGAVGPPETVVELPRHVPDGLAFDADGNLYVACYTPDAIYRLSPDGELALLAEDWEGVTFATPTNVAFCGPDRRTLVVASLSRWHLSKGTMPIPGQPLHYPRLGAS